MLMCAIVTGWSTTNAICSRACERPLCSHQHLNLPFHTWCLWALYVHMKISWHICRQTWQRKVHAWIQCGPAALWCAGLKEEVNQAPTGPPSLVLDWLCHCSESYEIILASLLKFNQNPVPLRNDMQIGWLRMMNITIHLLEGVFTVCGVPLGAAAMKPMN